MSIPVAGFHVLHSTKSSLSKICKIGGELADPPQAKTRVTWRSYWCSKKSTSALNSRPKGLTTCSRVISAASGVEVLISSASVYSIFSTFVSSSVMCLPPTGTYSDLKQVHRGTKTHISDVSYPRSTTATTSLDRFSPKVCSSEFIGAIIPGTTPSA